MTESTTPLNALLDEYERAVQQSMREDGGDDSDPGKVRAEIIQCISEGMPKWIPVSERMPKGADAVMCLAFSPTDSDGDASLPGALLSSYDQERGWASRTDTGCWEPGEITHWMPLPEGPK